MRVLGISAYYHDASATLIENGRVIASAAEERFTYQKHDPNFPKFAIDFCLNEAGISAQDLDAIAFYEEPHVKFARVLSSAISSYPKLSKGFVPSMRDWLTSKLWIKNTVSKRLNVNPKRIQFVPHHLSHAAQAFFASPFDEAAVLVVDAVGESTSTSLYRANRKSGVALQELISISYPHSLGLVYSAFTAFLGFRVNDGECSTMALSAFGSPVYAEQIRKMIQVQSDGTYIVDKSYFNFDELMSLPFSKRFIETFGVPRGYKDPLPFHSFSGISSEITTEHQRFADIAASIQCVFEEALLGLCKKLHRDTGLTNLCYAGGGALNCVANARLQKETSFTDIYIPNDPGDGGASMGAAYFAYAQMAGANSLSGLAHPYMGKAYDEKPVIEMLEHVHADHWIGHREIGEAQARGLKLKVTEYTEPISLATHVTNELVEGKIVGWYQGRFEMGPRALGNRSILCDPRQTGRVEFLSRNVKLRAAYRPYALSLLEEKAGQVLVEPPSRLSMWMQTTAKIKPNAKSLVAGGCHVDDTTRPQVCSARENETYHSLLQTFYEATGVPALLNTSFNDSGFPIVSSPAEALLMFARTDMDALALNGTLIQKVKV